MSLWMIKMYLSVLFYQIRGSLTKLIVYPQLEKGDYLPFTSKCDCLRCNKESPATVHFIKQNWRKEDGYDFKVMIAT